MRDPRGEAQVDSQNEAAAVGEGLAADGMERRRPERVGSDRIGAKSGRIEAKSLHGELATPPPSPPARRRTLAPPHNVMSASRHPPPTSYAPPAFPRTFPNLLMPQRWSIERVGAAALQVLAKQAAVVLGTLVVVRPVDDNAALGLDSPGGQPSSPMSPLPSFLHPHAQMPPEPEESSALFRLPELVRVFDELSTCHTKIVTVSCPDAKDFTPMLLSYTIKVNYKQVYALLLLSLFVCLVQDTFFLLYRYMLN